MYRTLFDLAGFAMLGWLLVIFLPGWKWTRAAAETAVFPLYLAAIYLVGIVAYIGAVGPGFMADFGSASGVLGLLAVEEVALIAWIHILAFDQVVGLLIYRDNMVHRFVPLPVQSVILFATLMLGPVGFLSYVVVRMARQKGRKVAWGEAQMAPAEARERPGAVVVPQFSSVVRPEGVVATIRGLLAASRAVTALGVLGLLLASMLVLVAAINGGWTFGREGRLLEAAKFDGAIGIYLLTLALLLPLAPLSERGRRRWVAATVAVILFSYGVETIQTLRGLDPRFSSVAGPLDQAIGGVFLLAAFAVLGLFVVLMRSFFRAAALPDHPGLRLAIRYGAGGAMIAFGVGVAMSFVTSGRTVGAGGDLMSIHAAGFHGLQAVPLVALLLGASILSAGEVIRVVHLAGTGWIILCIGLVLQAAAGLPPLTASLPLLVAGLGVFMWTGALVYAVRLRSARIVPPAALTT